MRLLRFLLRAIEVGSILILLGAAFYHTIVSYGIEQGIGELRIVWNARPIKEVMDDPQVNDSVKSKLQFIEEVKKFASDSLGLKLSENYSTFYDQHGKPLLWVLSASEKYRLKAYEWKFPVVGQVGYKGFFDYGRGKKEEQKLIRKNYETDYSPTSAWSTLGWFRDPVLSGFFRRGKDQVAELIIHEMTHATYYAKSSVDFNENLASAVGETGAEKFIASKFGKDSDELQTYRNEMDDYNRFADHLLRGTKKLDSLYNSMREKSSSEKDSLKAGMILQIVSSLDTIPFHNKRYGSRFDRKELPNNSYFLSFVRYDAKKAEMKKELMEKYHGNIHDFIESKKENR